MDDGVRALVVGRADEERVCELADSLRGIRLRSGDQMRLDPRSNLLLEKLPRPEVEDLLLEEVPDISYADIGGLDDQIEQIADAVELPFLYQELFAEHRLPAPKGILLYGPPGCGKTLIAKAVANSLAKKVADTIGEGKGRSYFINIKGPELLNKYVGETERQIRLVFQRAAGEERGGLAGHRVLRRDGLDVPHPRFGISSDMESTIVPQLLAEIDGVEGLRNVIVIGATNREDLIDPAILRPGRLDVKIKIERPNAQAATQIFAQYLTDEIPIAEGSMVPDMIADTVDEMYREDDSNRFLEVTYQNGDKEILYYKDFASGAMIENIVRRAKKLAIKRVIAGGAQGRLLPRPARLDQAGVQGARGPAQHHQSRRLGEDLGKKGERIVFIRTLVSVARQDGPMGGRAIERGTDRPVPVAVRLFGAVCLTSLFGSGVRTARTPAPELNRLRPLPASATPPSGAGMPDLADTIISDGVRLWVRLPSAEGLDAPVEGTLRYTEEDDCFLLERNGVAYPVVWPTGTTATESGPTVVSKAGESIALGQYVSGAGGYLDAAKDLGIPAACVRSTQEAGVVQAATRRSVLEP